jgi:hypothetical protein
MRRRFLLPALFFAGVLGAQHETRMQHAGAGVNGGPPESRFLVHRLGNDHAYGYLNLVSGVYWYENPGAKGGDWKRHQWAQ